MDKMKQKADCNSRFQKEMFSLVMDAVMPWAFAQSQNRGAENWQIADISQYEDQTRVCIIHVTSLDQYTALVCCHDEPEVIAVSYTNGNLGVLNPYIDSGHKLEADLDGPGCWNVLSITFRAEPGAEKVCFLRRGIVEEVSVNQFGYFSIVDWDSNQPVDEYLGVKLNGVWTPPVVAATPYTINYVTACWRKAVERDNGLRSRWNRWITAAFVELCGADRATLQSAMMKELAAEKNQKCYQAFKQERRKFLEREKRPLDELLLNA